jgi:imidazolonepropionase-like amidohydrolase
MSMRREVSRTVVPLVWAILCASSAPAAAQNSVVITGATVIDGTGTAPLTNRTVIITGDRIAGIVDAADTRRIPKGARVIQGQGKFLIPGLWDMHVHLTETDLGALVANGVTGVRDMGNFLSEVDSWRAEIGTGTRVGPRIFRVGPIINGQAFGPAHVAVNSDAEARSAVRVLKHVGVDAIKIHRALSREAYFALTDEAKKLSIPFVGHIPDAVTAQEASDAGQASLEHMQTLFESAAPVKQEETPALFARLVKNHNAFTPTLANYRGSADPANIDADLLRRYPDLPAGRQRIFNSFVQLVGLMNRTGVTLMAGSDLGSKWISPGSSLHDELAILVEAGLTPMQALQTATVNPARFLRIDAGAVEEGKFADLVLLDADPLVDIHNTRRIHAVILRGKLLDSSVLQTLLKSAQSRR